MELVPRVYAFFVWSGFDVVSRVVSCDPRLPTTTHAFD